MGRFEKNRGQKSTKNYKGTIRIFSSGFEPEPLIFFRSTPDSHNNQVSLQTSDSLQVKPKQFVKLCSHNCWRRKVWIFSPKWEINSIICCENWRILLVQKESWKLLKKCSCFAKVILRFFFFVFCCNQRLFSDGFFLGFLLIWNRCLLRNCGFLLCRWKICELIFRLIFWVWNQNLKKMKHIKIFVCNFCVIRTRDRQNFDHHRFVRSPLSTNFSTEFQWKNRNWKLRYFVRIF